ncbi:hypothetical protein LTR62_008355 [Meristemomyces frigidus]|uniref:Metallothionein-I gene transcription activator n=1 Tax=Meristemomyces frigidus TaxID=1508187 RepID=A0AAN7YCN9_9PEZI|nr:hypothetical protein LTR62_008355 [Meristemomyces frigidus]
MSRDQTSPPQLQQPSIGGGSAVTTDKQPSTYTNFNITGSGNFEDAARPVQYLCGDCDAKVTLRKSDPIRCKECGYRVLYKERTNRMIQFEAR